MNFGWRGLGFGADAVIGAQRDDQPTMTSFTTDTSVDAQPLDVRLLAPGDPQREAALAMALSGNSLVTTELRRQFDALAAAAARQGLGLDVLVGAFAGERILSAALAIQSPGRSVMVQMVLPHDDSPAYAASRAALQHLRETVATRGMLLLQALVQPEDDDLPDVYRSVGFRYLTDLLYLDAPMARERVECSLPPGVELRSYNSARHRTFIEALEATYVESLDCPGLTGLRTTEDVLIGHRATGVYDPQGWYVALRGEVPIGVLLTAQLPQRSALEVVYIGVCRNARGQGVGNCLMHAAQARARQLHVAIVTLAVDATNAPARKLYARWGFRPTHRRRVWIAALGEQFQS